MEKIKLFLYLTEEELEIIPQEFQIAMTRSKDLIEQEIARTNIGNIYNGLDELDSNLKGRNFLDLFEAASKYRWPLDPELVILLNIALRLRFNRKAVTNPFELKLISDVVNKKEIGTGLGESPWRELFLESAKTKMPEVKDIPALITAVKGCGIDQDIYILALREAVISEEIQEGFSLDTLGARKILGIAPDDESSYIDRILRSIDATLKNDGSLVYKVIVKYETLLNKGIDIGPGRKSVVDAYRSAQRKAKGGMGDERALRAAMEAKIIPMVEDKEKKEEIKTKPWWQFWK